MPKYTYKCLECGDLTVAHHSASKRLEDCSHCTTLSTLRKVPSKINIEKTESEDVEPVGNLVKEHIDITRQEISSLKEKFKEGLEKDE